MINFIECDTEQEAKIKVNEFIRLQKYVFCPIIKTNCSVDCICYSAPHVFIGISDFGWFAYNMSCSSPMIAQQEV